MVYAQSFLTLMGKFLIEHLCTVNIWESKKKGEEVGNGPLKKELDSNTIQCLMCKRWPRIVTFILAKIEQGDLVVSVLAFFFNNLSSNTAEGLGAFSANFVRKER